SGAAFLDADVRCTRDDHFAPVARVGRKHPRGKHADRHDRSALRLAGGDEVSKVVAGPAPWHGLRRAGIEEVVVHLRRIEASAVDDLSATLGIAQSGEADEFRQTLSAHAL